ncbi:MULTISPECIES: tRNA glutamyl-Q(34) synthetase GluQRS [unclassified Chelatococcus]|uniref:tRNA glutamyl-Q(34) synthetase GluQRS n=1 Tax=unclassified Chelatococcus TaxID=2638111 RepID=UPI001BCEC74C|nr:tRNA glutamyl-Q(34) synthetase GluQRS [Chelatococcus sp.]MBS7741679.1 tRNA glutamyl-Q(34) synthetase GluQRS [Chelatococcus sp. HY11]MBX3544302.1 tRNA glutamyl-Q(34) synthetase GluQRS [Chelatococcus sp.]MCO5079174.1 tRNA glutamyl-Q(34) synthetase GluQRS [Chelatococcus sp.]
MQPVFRFAPSPNGYLHLGHAYSALLNNSLAMAFNGIWLLRIEDIDTTRCRPAFEQALYEDLEWLGLTWPAPVLRQSRELGVYRAALARLDAMGLLYPCAASRQDIAAALTRREAGGAAPWPRDPDGTPRHPGLVDRLSHTEAEAFTSRGEPVAWRLDMGKALATIAANDSPLVWMRFTAEGELSTIAAQAARWGDVVLARKDIGTSYHLSVVVDDARQGVTHVVRGKDLEAATDVHCLLQRLLGLPTPAYLHHDLIQDSGGEKLAKSRGSTALRELRAGGLTAADIWERLGFAPCPD